MKRGDRRGHPRSWRRRLELHRRIDQRVQPRRRALHTPWSVQVYSKSTGRTRCLERLTTKGANKYRVLGGRWDALIFLVANEKDGQGENDKGSGNLQCHCQKGCASCHVCGWNKGTCAARTPKVTADSMLATVDRHSAARGSLVMTGLLVMVTMRMYANVCRASQKKKKWMEMELDQSWVDGDSNMDGDSNSKQLLL